MQRRLTLAGMRPINNVVDVSNYVMLELGQPTHPYDLDRLPGGGLRRAPGPAGREARRPSTASSARSATATDCLICDAEGDAGRHRRDHGRRVVGDRRRHHDVCCSRRPTSTPMAIARTSKRLGLRTEASARFERGVDPEGIDRAVARFCELLGVGAGRRRACSTCAPSCLPSPRPIRVRTGRVNALLGTDLDDGADRRLPRAHRLRTSTRSSRASSTSTPPSWRPDVDDRDRRHRGGGPPPRLRHIARTVPARPARRRARRRTSTTGACVREVLVGAGRQRGVDVAAPRRPATSTRAGLTERRRSSPPTRWSREESVLRTSLLPGLLRAVAFNAVPPRAGRRPVRDRPRLPAVPLERASAAARRARARSARSLAGAAVAADAVAIWSTARRRRCASPTPRSRPTTGRGPAPHPHGAAWSVGDVVVGVVGEVDPGVLEAHGIDGRVGWVELDLGALLAGRARRPIEPRPVEPLPVERHRPRLRGARRRPAAATSSARCATPAGDLLDDAARCSTSTAATGVGRRAPQPGLPPALLRPDRTLTDAEVGRGPPRLHRRRRAGRRRPPPRPNAALRGTWGSGSLRPCPPDRLKRWHEYADMCIVSADASGSGSSGRRGTRAPSCCGWRAGHPDLEVVLGHRRHPGGHPGRPTCTRAWPRPTRTWSSSDLRPGRGRRRSTSSSWPCPTARRRTSCPTCASGCGKSSTWPPTSG